MASDKTNDVLMKFCVSAADLGVPAECQTKLDWRNDIVLDFWDGYFFEVQEFGFGMNLDDSESADKAKNAPMQTVQTGGMTGGQAGQAAPRGITAAAAAAQRMGQGGAAGAAAPGGKFQRWKTMKPGQVLDPPYRLRLDEFKFTRLLDKASPVLFDHCCNSISFDSVALVKRKVTGDQKLQAFLRMDFNGVLITKLEWEDGEVIKEQCSFVFRGFQLQYLKQKVDGTLENAGMVGWKYTLDLTSPGDK